MLSLFIRKLFILPIRIYQWCISPFLPQSCRFYPTCSAYAAEAIARHGLFKGGFYALWRILRCHPFNAGGYDPVPPLRHASRREPEMTGMTNVANMIDMTHMKEPAAGQPPR